MCQGLPTKLGSDEVKQATVNLKREEVPILFWEPGILTGYRAINKPWIYYLRSLFKLHNETFNVWTHLVAPILYSAIVYRCGYDLDYWRDPSSWGILILGVTSSLSALGSAAAHLLHSRSDIAHYVMFSFDYMCIGLYGYGFGIMLYHSSGNELFYAKIGSVFPYIHAASATNITLCNLLARVLYQHRQCLGRKIMQAGSCAISILCCELIPVFRIYSCLTGNTCASDGIIHHIPYHVFTITNGILFSRHQPERTFPGEFDIFGHSHQLFHVSVVFCVIFQFYACYMDLLTLQKNVLLLSKPDWTELWGNLMLVVFLNLTLIFYFQQKFVKYTKRNNLTIN